MITQVRPASLGLALLLIAGPASAYTAAGDRDFPATILLPQIGPTDESYFTGASQPVPGGRESALSATFDKTVIERLGIGLTEGYGFVQTTGQKPATGWQNLTLIGQYTAIVDRPAEFLLSLGFEREFGGTGAVRAGAEPDGATTPLVYFGKGLGDAGPAWLRPLAIVGNAGYALGDTAARPDLWTGGIAFEYSFPYLTSKVEAGAIPDFLRGVTPMVEITAETPVRATPDAQTAITVAPGVAIAGAGWELGLEAPIAVTRGAGQGVGVALQLHLALDYLMPERFGTPLLDRD